MKKTKPRNAFYAQSGGVTAVINASAAGVIETAARYPKAIGKVYAGRHGIVVDDRSGRAARGDEGASGGARQSQLEAVVRFRQIVSDDPDRDRL